MAILPLCVLWHGRLMGHILLLQVRIKQYRYGMPAQGIACIAILVILLYVQWHGRLMDHVLPLRVLMVLFEYGRQGKETTEQREKFTCSPTISFLTK